MRPRLLANMLLDSTWTMQFNGQSQSVHDIEVFFALQYMNPFAWHK
jgi:hypothetical protein